MTVPSDAAMPALSWPRCCSAYTPRYVRLEASVCPQIPNTPHSSLHLSIRWPGGERYKCTASRNRPRGFEIFFHRSRPEMLGTGQQLVQCQPAIDRDRDPAPRRHTDTSRRHLFALRQRDQLILAPSRDRNDHPRGRFPEQRRDLAETGRRRCRRYVNDEADAGAKGTLGERDRQAALGAVVRRSNQARRCAADEHTLERRLPSKIDDRWHTANQPVDHLQVFAAAKLVAALAEQHHDVPRRTEGARDD